MQNPEEQELCQRALEISVRIQCFGLQLCAFINTGALVTTVSAMIGRMLERRGASRIHGETLLQLNRAPLYTSTLPAIHSSHTLEVPYTYKEKEYSSRFAVVPEQPVDVIFGMGDITRIGYRFLLDTRSPAAKDRRREKRRLQRRAVRRHRARQQDEGIDSMTDSEDISSNSEHE